MMCKKPFSPRSVPFPVPCGQCMHCRINRRRVWAHRMELETYLHSYSAFVTLTYDEKHLPKGGTLVVSHLQDWLKRICKAIEPAKLRFYAVGEYGDKSGRPHYHAAMFGLRSCYYGRSQYGAPYNRANCCSPCDLVRDTWKAGRVHLDSLNSVTAGYIAGYICKKLTKKGDPRLGFRSPEFAVMSRRPGIGAGVIPFFSKQLLSPGGRLYLDSEQQVPTSLVVDGKRKPLGRFLKEKLHAEVLRAGVVLAAPGYSPQALQYAAKMRAVRARQALTTPLRMTTAHAIEREFHGRRVALEAREKFARVRSL